MSTAAVPAIPKTKTGNTFQFVSHSGKTKITYSSIHQGPLRPGETANIPSLSYDGPEGQLSFSGAQISQLDSALGTLISVPLKLQNDSGAITFSLFLPTVIMGSGTSETFTTYGVKTSQRGFSISPGADRTYEVECLTGTAESITIRAL